MIVTEHVYDAQAQAPVTPVETTWIVFSGVVTVNGETPAHGGFTITARIGDVYESQPAIVRVSPTGSVRYEYLLVNPPEYLDLIGSQIEFWMNGEVRSTVTNWYAILQPCPESNSLCPVSDWWGIAGIFRDLDLDFPNLPDPEPTPDVTPTPLPTTVAVPTTIPKANIGDLRVGGAAIPPAFALIAMLIGSALVLVGYSAFSRQNH